MVDYNEVKAYTDPLWRAFKEVPSSEGEIGEVYQAFLRNGSTSEEAHFRTLAFIFRKATKEGLFYSGFSLWDEAKWG